MEPDILDDIREIEKLHRKLQVAKSPYDARKRYAECLRDGLAAWNEGHSCIYSDDVKAAEAFRKDGTWSDRLGRYNWLVLGEQGYGLFREDGRVPTLDMIDFWYQITPALRRAVEAEAYLVATTCAASHAFDPDESDPMRKVLQLHDAEVCEALREASSNAREQVEKEAAALPAPPPPVTDAPLPDPAPPTAKSGRPADPDRDKYFKMMARRMWNGLENKGAFCEDFLDEISGAAKLFKDKDNLRTQFGQWLNKQP